MGLDPLVPTFGAKPTVVCIKLINFDQDLSEEILPSSFDLDLRQFSNEVLAKDRLDHVEQAYLCRYLVADR